MTIGGPATLQHVKVLQDMKRRDFLTQAAWAGVLASTVQRSHAQAGPFVEGRHYVRLTARQPVLAPAGKIEVVEFFWYGCPHCYKFEGSIDAWIKTLPFDVQFRRVPVAFRPLQQLHQRLYFALETMGQLESMHRRVFAAMHVDNLLLDTEALIADFVSKNGLNKAKFLEVFNRFSLEAKANQARQLSEGYKIDGVPALGIHGRFYTSPSQVAGDGASASHARALQLTDQLVAQVRSNR